MGVPLGPVFLVVSVLGPALNVSGTVTLWGGCAGGFHCQFWYTDHHK